MSFADTVALASWSLSSIASDKEKEAFKKLFQYLFEVHASITAGDRFQPLCEDRTIKEILKLCPELIIDKPIPITLDRKSKISCSLEAYRDLLSKLFPNSQIKIVEMSEEERNRV